MIKMKPIKEQNIKNYGIVMILLALLCGCSKPNTVELLYLKGGKTYQKKILADDYLNQDKKIQTQYIDSVRFSILDSISFENNNPDNDIEYSTPVKLDFSKKIERYSPEYYTLATVYYTNKAENYYNSVFDGKIDFNSQENGKIIDVIFGDIGLLSSGHKFIIKEGSLLSPSIFYHEIGHRAFWYLVGNLKIKLGWSLTYVHMGLLEYFTTSLNNFPIIGEGVLPPKIIRNATLPCHYPISDSLSIKVLLQLLKESFPEEMKDSTNNISRYINLTTEAYGKYDIYDNHRAAMLVTAPLWRIREELGQEKTDKLVAQTILNLNKSLSLRPQFYKADKDETLSENIDWFDLVFGLIQKDKELFTGNNEALIRNEFKKNGFPVEKIQSAIVNNNPDK